MADNITLTKVASSTTNVGTLASDDVGGVQYPRSKLCWGVDGSAVDASVSNPLPISDAGGSLTVDGTFWQETQPVSIAASVAVTDGGGSVTIDGTVSVSGVVPGTSATSLGKAEDDAASSGDVGVMALAIRKDTPATTVGADGDYHPLEVDGNGRLWTSTLVTGDALTSLQLIDDAIFAAGVAVGKGFLVMGETPAGNTSTFTIRNAQTVSDTDKGVVTRSILYGVSSVDAVPDAIKTDAAGAMYVSVQGTVPVSVGGTTVTGGDVAHDAADSGNPNKIGAKATTALSGLTLVANSDRTDLRAGVDGVLINRPHSNLEDIVSGNASNTDGTSTSCIASSGAGVKTYLTTIILTNTSSSNIYVEIKDGATAKLTIPVPANGGAVVNLPVPLGGTAATAWNFDPSAAATTVYCSMVGFKSKV